MGSGPEDLEYREVPTSTPLTTLEAVIAFFRSWAGLRAIGTRGLRAIGIASFGPVDLRRSSPSYGHITATPKLAWKNFDLAGAVGSALRLPIGFDTDVNAAALGEARWGAAQYITDFVYVTVGTGIGGGALVGGSPLHGLQHPEMGHIRVPHDWARDPYAGNCPYHGDCLEGLASGPAIEARWGMAAGSLPADHPAWELEAHYLALALMNWIATLSPSRIVLGGGVMQQSQLFPLMRRKLQEQWNGYIPYRELQDGIDRYIVPSKLGDRAGVLGALVLAEAAAHRDLRVL